MKMLLKRLGIFFVIAGVTILAYSEFSKVENNSLLIVSGGFIVGGLVVYIIFNNIFE
jgi:putative effector of murein hydrolase LrgA (UPF0299 family)